MVFEMFATVSIVSIEHSDSCLNMPLIPCLQFALGWHRSLILFIPASMEDCMLLESTGSIGLLAQLTRVSMDVAYLDGIGR